MDGTDRNLKLVIYFDMNFGVENMYCEQRDFFQNFYELVTFSKSFLEQMK